MIWIGLIGLHSFLMLNNNYINELSKKPIVIFTASSAGLRVLVTLKKYNLFPTHFCDNSKLKHNTKFINLPVLSIDALYQLFNIDGCNIIIASKVYYNPIFNQLKDRGFSLNNIFSYDIEKYITTGERLVPIDTDSTNLHNIQMDLLSIMVIIHNICENNDLTYYLFAGTLLGAIRHKGFIPWDDDFDIVMPRRDYEKLFKILKKTNIEGYIVTDPFMPPNFDDHLYRFKNSNNLYIDIFPLDNINLKKSNKLLIQDYLQLILLNAIKYKSGYSLENHILIRLLSYIHNKALNKLRLFICTFYNNRTNYYYYFAHRAFNHKKNIINKSNYKNKELHNFEDQLFWIPSEWDIILHNKYQNYMKLPPLNKRY